MSHFDFNSHNYQLKFLYGDTTIGSSPNCNISINGSGILSTHCTIYRNQENKVMIVPAQYAYLLVDGVRVFQETPLTQGAMITIGKSNFLRFNNPAVAKMMRSAMISKICLDSHSKNNPNNHNSNVNSQHNRGNLIKTNAKVMKEVNSSPDSCANLKMIKSESGNNNINTIDLASLTYPKVFSSNHITVNMPAKDVLGQKYANFAKNLADTNRKEKNKNNVLRNNITTSENLQKKSYFIKNVNLKQGHTDILAKINNVDNSVPILNNMSAHNQRPKMSAFSFLQDSVNNEMVDFSVSELSKKTSFGTQSCYGTNKQSNSSVSALDIPMNEQSEDILKIFTEYTEKQQPSNCCSLTSSPIVQNRIKTNGSLPRDKKTTLLVHDLNNSKSSQSLLSSSCNNIARNPSNLHHNISSLDYEDKNGKQCNDLNEQFENNELNSIVPVTCSPLRKYENIFFGKKAPHSPRTKIRTTCLSPKKEYSIESQGRLWQPEFEPVTELNLTNRKTKYETLIKQFEERINLEIQGISSGLNSELNENIASEQAVSQEKLMESDESFKDNQVIFQSRSKNLSFTPNFIHKEDESKVDTDCVTSMNIIPKDLGNIRKSLLARVHQLKCKLADMQKQETEMLREMNLEKTLVKAEMSSVGDYLDAFKKQLNLLQNKIHCLDVQRTASRVIAETQQAQLKRLIEIKQEQIEKLKKLLKQRPNNACIADELNEACELLENDRKAFEDLEFQYLEEESEWQAYREEISAEEKVLIQQIEKKSLEMQNLEKQEIKNENCASFDTKSMKNNMVHLIKELVKCQERLLQVDWNVPRLSDQIHANINEKKNETCKEKLSANEHIPQYALPIIPGTNSRTLFGSTEVLFPKAFNDDIMSKSVNENMFYNGIEVPSSEICMSRDLIKSSSKLLKLHSNDGSKHLETNNQNAYNKLNSSNEDDLNVLYPGTKIIYADDNSSISKNMSITPTYKNQNQQPISSQNGYRVNENKKLEVHVLGNVPESLSRCGFHAEKQWPEINNTVQLDNDFIELTKDSVEVPNIKIISDDKINCVHQRENNATEISRMEINKNTISKSESILLPGSERRSEIENVHINTSEGFEPNGEISERTINNYSFLSKHQRPLTRYLPICSSELNLRNHITSAGHQISLCPHVFVDEYSCRGYLYKLGATFRGWARRWFVLDRRRNVFIYFSDKSERKPRGGAYFLTIDEVYLDHLNVSRSGRPHSTFIVKTKKRSYNLQAPSDAAARIWIDAIITGAQGNFET